MIPTLKEVLEVGTTLSEGWRRRRAAKARELAALRLLYLEVLGNIEALRMFDLEAKQKASGGDPEWAAVASCLSISAHEAVYLEMPRGRGDAGLTGSTTAFREWAAAGESVVDDDDGIEVDVEVPSGMGAKANCFVSVSDSLRFVCMKVRALAAIAGARPSTLHLLRDCRFAVRLTNIRVHETHLRVKLAQFLGSASIGA